MSQRLELLQEQFRNFDFRHPHVVEHLQSQSNRCKPPAKSSMN